ncbi:hydroxymethylbilane synthase [Kocuria sp. JC486]|uniref:hydroxymethylbilane synthase n=1 Tax=Kocuria sp. JC486 TaxID=1970736 RepID=UPI0014204CB0|nr:hydroxymethylbilane synthase [Kocuria sp. JC486]NHU84444.1 hydroxymethylbilane synthase [Kocuria sp. JC486]
MSSAPTAVLRVGTRGSDLAVTQTGHAAQALSVAAAAAGAPLEHELTIIRTEGDVATGSLASLGGTGVFAAALRHALVETRVDLAVHSLKDLPTAPHPGLAIGAVPVREDPRDALCARDCLALADLPLGAKIGTGSPRRAAQLLAARPDLVMVDIRGNVPTRLGRVAGLDEDGPGDLDAVVLAASGLNRLGLGDRITEYLDPSVVLPAPGQGALALEVRADLLLADPELATQASGAYGEFPSVRPDPGRAGQAELDACLLAALGAVNHQETRWAVTAERSLLARLEAGCAAPVGTLATVEDGLLVLRVAVAAPDGSRIMRRTEASDELSAEAARELGRRVGDGLLADGAAALAGLA